jgi:hypothetical protein
MKRGREIVKLLVRVVALRRASPEFGAGRVMSLGV